MTLVNIFEEILHHKKPKSDGESFAYFHVWIVLCGSRKLRQTWELNWVPVSFLSLPVYTSSSKMNNSISKVMFFSYIVFSLFTCRIHSCVSVSHSNSSEAAKLSFLSLLSYGTGGEINCFYFTFF